MLPTEHRSTNGLINSNSMINGDDYIYEIIKLKDHLTFIKSCHLINLALWMQTVARLVLLYSTVTLYDWVSHETIQNKNLVYDSYFASSMLD
ncbi:hypothetical protein BLOT_003515 [Blomia tropicalis]|nr:hypothetical protein BLOT_003515 [Blomia tropicalis]